jgi:hypothetical protein
MDTVLIVLTCASVAAAAAFGISAWRSRAEEARRSAARVAALSAAIDGADGFASAAPVAPAHRPVAVTSMFATTSGASVNGLPLVKTGVFGALALAFLVVVAMANRNHAAAPASAGSSDVILELVSMQHAREGRTLTVTGLVRNPRTGVPRSNIDAPSIARARSSPAAMPDSTSQTWLRATNLRLSSRFVTLRPSRDIASASAGETAR